MNVRLNTERSGDLFLGSFFCFCLGLVWICGSGIQRDLTVGFGFTLVMFHVAPALGVLAYRSHTTRMRVFLLIQYVLAALLLPYALQTASLDYSAVSDFYLMLLLIGPVLLRLWGWQFQAILSLLVVLSKLLFVLTAHSWADVLSCALLLVAALVSTVVLLLTRSTNSENGSSETIFPDLARTLDAGAVFSALVLMGGVLLVSGICDIFLWGEAFVETVSARVYPLMIVLLLLLVLRLLEQSKPETASRMRNGALLQVILFSGVIVSAAALSYSRSVYLVEHQFFGVLPLLFLFLVVLQAPLLPLLHSVVLWSILLLDAVTQVVFFEAQGRSGTEFTDAAWLSFVMLAVGALILAVLSRLLAISRYRSLGDLLEMSEGIAERIHEKRGFYRLPRKRLQGIRGSAEAKQRLVLAMFLGASVALFCTSYVLEHADGLLNAALLVRGSLIVGCVLWSALLLLERRASSEEVFWTTGVLIAGAIVIWPTVVLIRFGGIGEWWYLWVVAVGISIGVVPWTRSHVVSLFCVAFIAAFQLVQALSLGVFGSSLIVSAVLGSILASMSLRRRLEERQCLEQFSLELLELDNRADVLRSFGAYALSLTGSERAILRRGSIEEELVQAGFARVLAEGESPRTFLSERSRDLNHAFPGVRIAWMSWVEKGSAGAVSTIHQGLRVFFEDNEDYLILPSTSSLVNGPGLAEIRAITSLCASAALRITALEQSAQASIERENFARQVNEREQELSALVHDINNTVQDMTLLCDELLEETVLRSSALDEMKGELQVGLTRVANVARSVATVVSDAKRRRELERTEDLLPREVVDLSAVMREMVRFAELRAERKRMRILLDEPAGETFFIKVSMREHLETILRNIITNALQYSPPGSLVEVRIRGEGERVEISITDQGPGVAPDERERIFLPGFRGKASQNFAGGLGLGLHEVKRVVESAGGMVTVRDHGAVVGTTFVVSLPRIQHSPKQGVDGRWALIVDDQPSLGEFYAKLARAMRLLPIVCYELDHALRELETRGKPFVVLTDLHLGNQSGFSLVEAVRAKYGERIPIVIISGITDPEVQEQARIIGATDYITKPVRRRALFARLESLLDLHDEQAGGTGI